MKITVTKRNIKSAQSSNGKMTPIELAVLDLEMFEEVLIKTLAEDKFSVYIDDMNIVLPVKANKALAQFNETGEMKPFSFELNIEKELDIPTEDFGMMELEGGFDLGFDLDFA